MATALFAWELGSSIDNAGTVQIDGSGLSGLGQITNAGTVCFAYDGTVNLSDLTLSGGTYEISASTTATLSSTLALSDANLLIDYGGGLGISGTMSMSSGATINAFGTLDVSGTLNLAGTLNLNQSGTVAVESGGLIYQTGQMNIYGNSNGVLNIKSGGSMEIAAGTLFESSGTIAVAGTLTVDYWTVDNGCVLEVNGSLSASGTLNVNQFATFIIDCNGYVNITGTLDEYGGASDAENFGILDVNGTLMPQWTTPVQLGPLSVTDQTGGLSGTDFPSQSAPTLNVTPDSSGDMDVAINLAMRGTSYTGVYYAVYDDNGDVVPGYSPQALGSSGVTAAVPAAFGDTLVAGQLNANGTFAAGARSVELDGAPSFTLKSEDNATMLYVGQGDVVDVVGAPAGETADDFSASSDDKSLQKLAIQDDNNKIEVVVVANGKTAKGKTATLTVTNKKDGTTQTIQYTIQDVDVNIQPNPINVAPNGGTQNVVIRITGADDKKPVQDADLIATVAGKNFATLVDSKGQPTPAVAGNTDANGQFTVTIEGKDAGKAALGVQVGLGTKTGAARINCGNK